MGQHQHDEGGPRAHKRSAPLSVRCAVLTISDTRTEADDKSGALLREKLLAASHSVTWQGIVKDEPSQIIQTLDMLCGRDDVEAILSTGGTGLSPRDSTFEVISGKIERPLTGFGELFRMLSYEEIGSAAMLSRATAGVIAGKILFAMPGSSNAVRLALEKLILPELGHIIAELRKGL